MNISYYYKENGGKQRAYNYALDNAKGELFMCFASADVYASSALVSIIEY